MGRGGLGGGVALSLASITPTLPPAAGAVAALSSVFFATCSPLKGCDGEPHVFPFMRDLGFGGGTGFFKLPLPDLLAEMTELSLVDDPNTDPWDSMLPAACMLLLVTLLATLMVSEVSER